MEFLLRDIEQALKNKLYFIALQSSLALPDICGALVSTDGRASKNNYVNWYDTYAKEPYKLAISGEDCYYFRCSCLHQWSTQNVKSSYERIIFVVPDEHNNIFHSNIFNGALNIDINIFCRNIINSVRKWEKKANSNPNYIKNYPNLMKVYPNGLAPYITGCPIIS